MTRDRRAIGDQWVRIGPRNVRSLVGNFFQISVGPKWQLNPNMFVRSSGRFDWFDGDVLNAGGLKPYDNGEKDHQFIWVTDFVVLY